jgi:hypothetical protein
MIRRRLTSLDQWERATLTGALGQAAPARNLFAQNWSVHAKFQRRCTHIDKLFQFNTRVLNLKA